MRLAFVCILPDAGHVLPLARLAAEAAHRGHEARLFVPDERVALLLEAGLDAVGVGSVHPTSAADAIAAYFALEPRVRGLAYNRYVDRYLLPQNEAIWNAVPRLAEAVASSGPDALIVDDHRFREVYERLAASLAVPWALHSSAGSLPREGEERRLRRRFAARRSAAGPQVQRRLTSLLRVTRRSGAGRVARLRQAWHERTPEPSPPVGRLVAGLAPLERAHLHDVRGAADVWVAPPLPSIHGGSLDPEVQRFLDGGPTVYVSFGSHLRPPDGFLHRLRRALQTRRARVLWAGGKEQPASDRFSWRSWVAQPAVLAHPNVQAFVTHGGSGGLQEAAQAGIPTLVAPLAFDQFHNALVVEDLGIGVALDPWCSRADLDERLRELFLPHRQQRALALREELAAVDTTAALGALFEHLLGAGISARARPRESDPT